MVESPAGNVDTQSSSLTLAGAVKLAGQTPFSEIFFDPTVFSGPQTITLTAGPLTLSATTTIFGSAAGATISGGDASGVFQIDSGVAASLLDLTITGGSSSGNGGGVDNNGTLYLTASTISGNSAAGGGGGLFDAGSATATLINCTIADNSAGQSGGGVYNGSGATVVVTDCTISGNSASGGDGGGLYNVGKATLTDTIVAGNEQDMTPSDIGGTVTGSYNLIGSGGSGGLVNGTSGNIVGAANPGLGALGENGGRTPTIPLLFGSPAIGAGTPILGITTDQRGVFRGSYVDIGAYQLDVLVVESTAGNIDTRPGSLTLAGAVSLGYQFGANGFTITFDPTVFAAPQTITLTSGQLELSNNITISGPAAGVTISGGGQNRVFEIDYGVTASLSGLMITGGSSSGNGGGLYDNGTVNLTDCTVSGNSATDGGGIAFYANPKYQFAASLTDCTIDGNSARDGGGGLYSMGFDAKYSPADTVTLTGCTISNNVASRGAGLSNTDTLEITNCTISGNSAGGDTGGGLYNHGGTATVTACTITGNTVTTTNFNPYGGGLMTQNGTTTLTDTIVAGNSATGPHGGPSDVSTQSGTVSGSYNLIGTGGSGDSAPRTITCSTSPARASGPWATMADRRRPYHCCSKAPPSAPARRSAESLPTSAVPRAALPSTLVPSRPSRSWSNRPPATSIPRLHR